MKQKNVSNQLRRQISFSRIIDGSA